MLPPSLLHLYPVYSANAWSLILSTITYVSSISKSNCIPHPTTSYHLHNHILVWATLHALLFSVALVGSWQFICCYCYLLTDYLPPGIQTLRGRCFICFIHCYIPVPRTAPGMKGALNKYLVGEFGEHGCLSHKLLTRAAVLSRSSVSRAMVLRILVQVLCSWGYWGLYL